ncbi:MAG: 1-acylglycerol-3-phosphate O-acyltransferase [Burkholderiales bacterium]|nr:1-acylglycerol-3-phosphate O-acyltransferase [Burkholderiales bacterium]
MLHTLRLFLLGVHFLVAGAINMVIVLIRPFNPDNSRLCGRVYSLPALRFLGLDADLQVDEFRKLNSPCVVVVNHLSNFDLFIMGSVVPRRTVTIGKKSLRWVPIFGQIYWLAGNVLINRSNAAQAKQAMLETTEALQKRDTSIWVFVEGTRNLGKGLLPFKKGAFQMAIAAQVPIVPLCCSNYKRSMRLNRWHSGKLVIRALPPISTAGMTLDDMPELMERCHAQMVTCIDLLDAE